jgi:AcrR family transcriptional regulator
MLADVSVKQVVARMKTVEVADIKSKTRVTKDPEVRKAELIDAAEELFREKGYEQTSVSDIVKKIDVAQGTFYYYFKSKDDILDAVIDHYIDNSRKAVERLAADETIDPCKKVEILVNSTLNIYDEKLAAFMHSEENLATHQRYMLRSFDALMPPIVEILEQGVKAGVFNVRYARESVEILLYAFSYLQESIAMCRDREASARLLGAAEDILTRVLGAEPGRLKLDPGSTELLQINDTHHWGHEGGRA